MSKRTYYREYRAEDFLTVISLDLRQSDKEEIRASTGLNEPAALTESIMVSDKLWVVVHDGRIEGVFGITIDSPFAIPWFMATEKFKEFQISFAKESRDFIKSLLEDYCILVNLVDSRHDEAIRWLRWLGFEVNEDEYYYLHDPEVPFYRFLKVKEDCAYVRSGGGDPCRCANISDRSDNSGNNSGLCSTGSPSSGRRAGR